MIYVSAVYANAEHTLVTGTDAIGNTEKRSVDNPHEFRREDEFLTGFLANGGEIAEYEAPEEPPVVLKPELVAMGQVKTADGEVTSVAISAALAGAFLFDTGEIWCFFVDPQPDTNYIVLAYDSNSVRAFVEDDDKFADYFVIRSTDFDGIPTNSPSLNFEVKRVT